MKVPPLLLLVLVAGCSAQLAVGPIELASGHRAISFDAGSSPENSLIRCPFVLGDGQEIVAVVWELLKDGRRAGSFKWKPNKPGTTTGILSGKVNLRREDSDLELTFLDYDLAGTYSCTVKTSDGKRESARGEILIEGGHQRGPDPASTAASDYSVAELEVGPITIGQNQGYISFDEGPSPTNSVLRCEHRLAPGQEIASLVWRVQRGGRRIGSLKWKPNGAKTAFGMLKGKVNMANPSSDLEFTVLRYNMAATYSCTINLVDGTRKTAEEEILVVDTTGNDHSFTFHEDEDSCSLTVSEEAYVFPEPDVKTGMFSEQLGGYYQPFNNFEVTRHGNGSATYAYRDNVVYVDSATPLDAVYRTEVGVVKSNDEYVPITSAPSVLHVPNFERSCKDLEVDPTQRVSYNSFKRTCFGGIRRPESGSLLATVTCAPGYESNGYVDSDFVTVTCTHRGGHDYEWLHGEDGLMPYHLTCVMATTTEAPTTTTTTTTTEYPYPVYEENQAYDDYDYNTPSPDEYDDEGYDDDDYDEGYDGEDYDDEDYGEEEEDYDYGAYPEPTAESYEPEPYEPEPEPESEPEPEPEAEPESHESMDEEGPDAHDTCPDCEVSMGVMSGRSPLVPSAALVAGFLLLLVGVRL